MTQEELQKFEFEIGLDSHILRYIKHGPSAAEYVNQYICTIVECDQSIQDNSKYQINGYYLYREFGETRAVAVQKVYDKWRLIKVKFL